MFVVVLKIRRLKYSLRGNQNIISLQRIIRLVEIRLPRGPEILRSQTKREHKKETTKKLSTLARFQLEKSSTAEDIIPVNFRQITEYNYSKL